MARTFVVGVRLLAGSREEDVVERIRDALNIAREKGLMTRKDIYISRTEAGHILVIAELSSVRSIEAMDEDPDLQEAISRISGVAEAFPLHTLIEFSAARVTFEAIGP
ncbi:hypothetical protein EC912_105143 [Luteibacter rhizovicinus]|uniref:Antibiotic biosynthesis monooxygenase n=1 Tax=Luteibacter rhizovicinus TaxID=242606 RepID=A0A4R3YQR5_9GAMM|nr:hypothetical protein [Luteibacter rhizovicinus]TCV93283.1 hypothetical protein EC912_105143 [Luteibacter rhizovicinus]